jgi:hypothetical protein
MRLSRASSCSKHDGFTVEVPYENEVASIDELCAPLAAGDWFGGWKRRIVYLVDHASQSDDYSLEFGQFCRDPRRFCSNSRSSALGHSTRFTMDCARRHFPARSGLYQPDGSFCGPGGSGVSVAVHYLECLGLQP